MNKPEQTELIRTTCKKRLKYLCKEILGYKDWSKVHDDLEIFLDKPKKRKLVMVPRNHLKSSVITKGWSIQQMLRNPDTRILIANATWDNSRKFLGSIQKYLTWGSVLPQYFGRFESDNWNQFDCTVKQRKAVLDSPTFVTTGVDKEQTSQHYDIIIGDDLVGPQNVQTKEQRQKVFDYYLSLFDLLEPEGTIVMPGTRYHQDDLYARIFEEAKEQGNWDVFFRQAYNEDGSILFPEKFTEEKLKEIRSKPGGRYHWACTPGYTPILMGDFTTKPIEHVKVGDEVIGFTKGTTAHKSQLIRSRIKRTFSKRGQVLKLTMQSGRTAFCTKDHKWYTARDDASHPRYAPARLGFKMSFVCPVERPILSEKERQDWSYLAGLFDGEGSCKSGGTLALTQCESKNPDVHARIVTLFKDLKIPYGYNIRKIMPGRNHSPGNTQFWMRDSFRVGLNLIRETTCAKAERIASRFIKHGKRFVREKDRVVDIEYVGEDTVYALETETGNYIAWGYASSNSQYLNNPIDPESSDFKQEWLRFYDPTTQHPHSLYMTVDPAISLSRDADYSAFVIAGQFQDRRIRVVDCQRKRCVPSELVDTIFELVEKWKLHRIGVETFAFQKTIKYDIQRQQRERNIFFSVDELGKRHQGTGEPILSKEARIRRLQPYFEQGLIEFNKNMADLTDELLAFPRGKHDDMIDALAWQLDYLVPSQLRTPVHKVTHNSMQWWLDNHLKQPELSIYEKFMSDLR